MAEPSIPSTSITDNRDQSNKLINYGTVTVVTGDERAMGEGTETNAEPTESEAWVQILRADEKRSYHELQALIKVAKEVESKAARESRTSIAKSSSSTEEDQNTMTTDDESTDPHDDVKTAEPPTATLQKYGRLVLHPPKRQRQSEEQRRPTRLRLTQPKRPTRLRLSQPKRQPVPECRPTRLRLTHPKPAIGEDGPAPVEEACHLSYGRSGRVGATRLRRGLEMVRYGRVVKAPRQ